MKRFLLVLILIAMPSVARAQNITVRDIIELSKAGLNEQALVALVEVNPTVFPVDVETLKSLKDAGVAPSVITAMIRSGRMPQPPALPVAQPELPDPPAAPPAQVVVIEYEDAARVREVPVAVPVYVTVPVRRSHRRGDVAGPHVPSPPVRAAEPVFWGWGGKLRPDAWKPSIEPQKDAKIQIQKK